MKKQYKIDTQDTIAAISTPLGEGAIGIIRISGKEALKIADAIFKPAKGGTPSKFRPFTSHYGRVVDGQKSADETLLTIMRAPYSYTREDSVELSCHGGVIPLRRTLEIVLKNGARIAEPGEFTRRAFLNGRFDLAQAEAVLDIIRAKTDASLDVALGQLEGKLSAYVLRAKDELIEISAQIEASIDFPDEEINIMSGSKLKERLESVEKKLAELLETADKGIILRDGISCVICGKPNVGKSSLLNALLQKERAIVTHIPGTTRDSIEEFTNIGGVPFKLIDTAGIAPTEDIIEREGILRSREHIERSSLVLLVLDAGSRITDEDRILLDDTGGKRRMIVINKIDLPRRIDFKPETRESVFEISAKEGSGIEELKAAMAEAVLGGDVAVPEGAVVTNLRQKEAVRNARESVVRAIKAVEDGLSAELTAIEVRESLDHIGEIVGEVATDDILDRIFSRFCIGK